MPESTARPHHPPILVACRRNGEGGCRRSLVARGAALPGQVAVPLIRSVITAVHGVTVQTGASLGHLRHRRVAAQHRTPLANRWLSAENGAALQGLAQRRLSAEDGTPLRLLSQRRLSAEESASRSSLRQTVTEVGVATEPHHTNIKSISLGRLLAHDGAVLTTTRARLKDGAVSGAGDVRPVLCTGTSMADCSLVVWEF